MLILQQLFNLSDEELELQVNDRRSFLDCVRLGRMSPDGGRSCAAAQTPAGLWTVRKGYQILRSLVPPPLTLGGRGMQEARLPGQWYGDGASVLQINGQLVVAVADISDPFAGIS